MAYLYSHTRLDTNEVFYIGVGSGIKYNRSKSKCGRNNFWKRVIKKTDYKIDIIFDKITKKEARQLEIQFIQLYGRRDLGLGTLVNLTDGGDGIHNLNQESKDLISRKLRGNKNSLGSKGNINRLVSLETREKFKLNMLNNNRAKTVKVININTNIIYNSVTEAAKSINVLQSTLNKWLQGHRKNKTNLRYYGIN